MATKRRVNLKDVKILYSLAAGRCAFTDCRQELIIEAPEHDDKKQIGNMAHIVGHSDDGPRGDKNYPREKLNTYENLILLCPTHHDTCDVLDIKYTTDFLRKLKQKHEDWVKTSLLSEMINVGFPELEVVAKTILSSEGEPSEDFIVVPLQKKMNRNGLTKKVHMLLNMGLSKSNEVKDYINHVAMTDSSFPERLKSGFVEKYKHLKNENVSGDELFFALHVFSFNGSPKLTRQAAGLAVLTYLFECCEVFEK